MDKQSRHKTTKQQLQKGGGGGGKKRISSESGVGETQYLQIRTRLPPVQQGSYSPHVHRTSLSKSSSPDRGSEKKQQRQNLGNISGLQSLITQLRKLEKQYRDKQKFKS
jgi:hypothetical protein